MQQRAEDLIHAWMTPFPVQVCQDLDTLVGRPDAFTDQLIGEKLVGCFHSLLDISQNLTEYKFIVD